ncbi:hypothetical protein OHW50_00250 [Acinetobacter baumannii]|nr:hypothetical protein [Acinetobacter baumannii]
MKPEQFIREFGVEKARAVIQTQSNHKDYAFKQYGKATQTVDYADLKRLVESLEIINDLGGIKGAKGTLYNLVQLDWDEFEHRWIDNWMCTRPRLESAIKDHESIYGGGGDE